MLFLFLFYFKPTHWYDTLLCYSAGMMWSAKKENIDLFVKKHYLAVLTSLLAIFVVLHIHFLPYAHGLTYNMESIFFSIIIVLITMEANKQFHFNLAGHSFVSIIYLPKNSYDCF